MKTLVTFGLTLLLGLSFAQAQLVFWTTQVQPERMSVQEQIAADFEAETGISVQVVPVEESSLAERVTAAFSAGGLPDVIYHPLSQTVGWAQAGILDTDAATEVIDDLGRDTFSAGILNLAAYQDGYTAVPSDGWAQLLVYRKDLFEAAGLEPPTNYEAVTAAIAALHDPPDMYGFVAATDPSNDYMMQVLEQVFLANGVTLLNDAGEVDLDNERVVQALEFYKKLFDASPPGNLFWEQSRELYFAGKAAMIFWSPFILDELAGLRDNVPITAVDDPTSPELAENSGFVTRLAGPSNPEGAGFASASFFGITVDADTGAAQQFIEYIMDNAYLKWLSFAPEGLFPIRRGTAEEPEKYVEGWKELPIGVDRKAPLAQFYDDAVINEIISGLDVADRWAYNQGQGALIGQLYGTRVMSELVRAYLDGEYSAEETAKLLQERVSALQ